MNTICAAVVTPGVYAALSGVAKTIRISLATTLESRLSARHARHAKLAGQTSRHSGQTGLTLLELTIVCAIIGILCLLAFPSYQWLVYRTRVTAAANALHRDLTLARSEAIKRALPVSICRSETADSLTPVCASGSSDRLRNAGWADGWILFADHNKNGLYEPHADPAEQLISVQGRLIRHGGDGAIIPSPHKRSLTFTATGQSFGSFVRFAVQRASDDGNPANDRYICIASGGRARVAETSCSG